jgi:hypothetical protein
LDEGHTFFKVLDSEKQQKFLELEDDLVRKHRAGFRQKDRKNWMN